MNDYLSSLAKGLEPYTPGEQPRDGGYIKLNTNENPYPPSPGVLKAIRRTADESLRLYPDPESTELRKAASSYYGVTPEMIFAGNGSDEVLAFSFAAFYSGKRIVFPLVTYSFYPVYCKLFGVSYRELPMREGLLMDTDALTNAGCGVVLANPNAPTGELLNTDAISRIAEKNRDDVILVDEAYIDFGGESAVGLTDDFDNILVVQTFSKSHSLAGMRIGFGIGSRNLIEGLSRVKNSFNSYPLDRLAQSAGKAAFGDTEYYSEMRNNIIETREKSIGRLRNLGFSTVNTSSNFIFASHGTVAAGKLYQQLRERRILVRYFGREPIDDYIRITVGTDEQMDALFTELEIIVSGC